MMMKIKEAYAVYTGGGIWLFYGKLRDGNHFLTDDDGATLILDTNAEDLEESTWPEWQEEHMIRELELHSDEALEFCDELLDWLEKCDAASEYRGGMFNSEIRVYRERFHEG